MLYIELVQRHLKFKKIKFIHFFDTLIKISLIEIYYLELHLNYLIQIGIMNF